MRKLLPVVYLIVLTLIIFRYAHHADDTRTPVWSTLDATYELDTNESLSIPTHVELQICSKTNDCRKLGECPYVAFGDEKLDKRYEALHEVCHVRVIKDLIFANLKDLNLVPADANLVFGLDHKNDRVLSVTPLAQVLAGEHEGARSQTADKFSGKVTAFSAHYKLSVD